MKLNLHLLSLYFLMACLPDREFENELTETLSQTSSPQSILKEMPEDLTQLLERTNIIYFSQIDFEIAKQGCEEYQGKYRSKSCYIAANHEVSKKNPQKALYYYDKGCFDAITKTEENILETDYLSCKSALQLSPQNEKNYSFLSCLLKDTTSCQNLGRILNEISEDDWNQGLEAVKSQTTPSWWYSKSVPGTPFWNDLNNIEVKHSCISFHQPNAISWESYRIKGKLQYLSEQHRDSQFFSEEIKTSAEGCTEQENFTWPTCTKTRNAFVLWEKKFPQDIPVQIHSQSCKAIYEASLCLKKDLTLSEPKYAGCRWAGESFIKYQESLKEIPDRYKEEESFTHQRAVYYSNMIGRSLIYYDPLPDTEKKKIKDIFIKSLCLRNQDPFISEKCKTIPLKKE